MMAGEANCTENATEEQSEMTPQNASFSQNAAGSSQQQWL
jgi:hypothetical protein